MLCDDNPPAVAIDACGEDVLYGAFELFLGHDKEVDADAGHRMRWNGGGCDAETERLVWMFTCLTEVALLL